MAVPLGFPPFPVNAACAESAVSSGLPRHNQRHILFARRSRPSRADGLRLGRGRVKIPFDKDLSGFSEADLRAARRFLLRAWRKPWLWPSVVPAIIAIKYELEWRKAGR
jgi:hypothetical protein